jgi:hypothetical protein
MVTPMTTSLNRSRLTAVLVAALLAVPVLRAATRGPDPAGYSATDATVYSFVDVSGSGASVLTDTDDGTAALTLPFPFSFYGSPRTLLCVSANGAAYFVNALGDCTGLVDFANTDLSTTSPPGDWPSLLPFWTDLTFDQPGAGAVYYQTTGVPGTRTFIVQWERAYPTGSPSPVTFQMVLSESNGQALFQYKTVDLGAGNPATKGGAATIGSRNSNAQVSGQYLQWSYGVPVIENESAILVSRPTGPRIFGSGQVRPVTAAFRPSFTVDVTASPAGGTVLFEDPERGIVVVATEILSAQVASRGTRIVGTAMVNGQSGYPFTMTLTDDPDRFSITIRNRDRDGAFYNLPITPVTTGSLTVQP